MLNRQKTLLELVRLAGGRIDRLVLTKWAFLVRHETVSRGGDSFYDFVPYQYGPFSFGLYQEAEKLVQLGYLNETGPSAWSLGRAAPPAPDRRLQSELSSIVSRFQSATTNQLLDYVYDTYPRFTFSSKRKQLVDRPVASVAVYTAGYEGKSVDAFLNTLVQAGIAHVIDVRRNPIARRYGFHRSTLERLCGRLGMQYTHVPELGIPSEQRQQLATDSDYQTLFRQYEDTTLKMERAAIQKVADWVQQSPSVLVCMEANPTCCHRARLAKPVSRATALSIVHLD